MSNRTKSASQLHAIAAPKDATVATPIKRTLQATAAATLTRLGVETDSPPDRTRLPPPCSACNGVIYWRPFDSLGLHCHGCRPCQVPTAAIWYGAVIPGDPLADLYDPEIRADLAWLARRRPAIVSELLTLERRCDALADARDGQAFEDACRVLVDAVHRLCRQSRLMQHVPN